jgi:1-pyrroline-5-carboxylate dehydrogenase
MNTHKKFSNTPVMDFQNAQTLQVQRTAIQSVRVSLGKTVSLGSAEVIQSVNPFQPQECVVKIQGSTQGEIAEKIARADRAFQVWSRTSHTHRKEVLKRIADLLETYRYEFNALLMLEVGKPWLEADADTCEAIDFVRYYAESLNGWIENPNLVQVPGNHNRLIYIPLGVGSVISPWNFPLAILCGMTTAALVTGNTVLMKPSSDAIAIAYRFHQVLMEAGVPEDVAQLVVAPGKELGQILISHPRIRFVCFTGSRDVGVWIHQEGAKVNQGQIWLRRHILEMGGKDGILVDETADLDAAALGVTASAFGYSGQKCSACSRLIVHTHVKEALVQKVAQLTSALKLGDPTDPTTQMGPVVNRASLEKVLKYIEIGKQEGRLVVGGNPLSDFGYTIQPTVVDGIEEHHRLFQEEIFGPVLAVTVCRDFEDGIRLMNATPYGLTGAVYSRDAKRLETAAAEVFVGNLYLNRKCTGALVGQHPFGGFNMSGTDSKAGGPDYLGLFLQPKSVSQKL